MTFGEYLDGATCIDNKIYNLWYRVDEHGFVYVLEYSIKPAYQHLHRNYTARIFTLLCQKLHAPKLYLEAFEELKSFYWKAGCYTLNPDYHGFGEWWFDPTEKSIKELRNRFSPKKKTKKEIIEDMKAILKDLTKEQIHDLTKLIFYEKK